MNKQETSFYSLLLDTIKDTQDADYQERVWIRAEGSECDDFGETINTYFDLYDGIKDFKKRYSEYGITFKQYRLINSLSKKLRVIVMLPLFSLITEKS